jgi:hypothetical protein
MKSELISPSLAETIWSALCILFVLFSFALLIAFLLKKIAFLLKQKRGIKGGVNAALLLMVASALVQTTLCVAELTA